MIPDITNHLGKLLALTQVSHQVRAETDPLLYGQNTFEVMLRAAKVVEEPFPQQLARPSRGRKTRLLLLDENPVSETPEHLLYGDRYAAIWAASARPEALARIRRLTVTVEKADLNSQWRHLRHRHLSMSPSSISLERTGVFSAHRWHLHAIELKCPGRHTVVWDVDCRENRMGDRRLKWNAKDV
ncbi:hypothetical protein MBLNU13_g01014t1 [Cladosporium sp. NU13]